MLLKIGKCAKNIARSKGYKVPCGQGGREMGGEEIYDLAEKRYQVQSRYIADPRENGAFTSR